MSLDVGDIWGILNNYYAQFNNLSLPMGGLTPDDLSELWVLVGKRVNNLYKTNHNTNNIKIADIGCWTGASTSLFLSLANDLDGSVVSVDWFNGSEGTNLEFAGKYFNIRKIYDDYLKLFPHYDRITTINASSEEASKQFPDNHFDVVFLDADHRYENVKKDILLWLPKIKNGGILCGHDCEFLLSNGMNTLFDRYKDKDVISVLHLGVCKALYDLLPNAKHTQSGSIWFVEK